MEKIIDTEIDNFKLRFTDEEDVPLILSFIRQLAIYEKLLDEVVATEETLRDSLFNKKAAEVIIGEYNDEPVGFCLFFHNFSTFIGRPGLYLEDIYIIPEARGNGFGKVMLSYLARLAVERNCGRFEWACLDWNKPAINFYKQMGAMPMDEWTVYRLQGQALQDLAESFGKKAK